MSVGLEPAVPVFEAEIPPFPVRRWTVDAYHDMTRLGVLTSEDRVELLDGWIVEKMPHIPRHCVAIELVNQAVRELLPKGWRASV